MSSSAEDTVLSYLPEGNDEPLPNLSDSLPPWLETPPDSEDLDKIKENDHGVPEDLLELHTALEADKKGLL